MQQRTTPDPRNEPRDRRIHRTWLLFATAFAIFGIVLVGSTFVDGVDAWDLVLVGLLCLVGASAAVHWIAVRDGERDRRGEVEGFARILRGLSRSISADAIVGAIARELGEVAGADHVVVVRRPPDTAFVEATLVSMRPGVADVTTVLTGVDLDAEQDWMAAYEHRGRGARATDEPVPIPIEAGMPVAVAAGDRWSSQASPPVTAVADRPSDRVAGPSRVEAVRAGGIGADIKAAFGLTGTISAPLVADGRTVGAIVLSRRGRDPWPTSARRLLAAAAAEASAALSRAYSFRQAQARATTDALTGLPNRAYFDELCGLLARRRRADDAVGILMIDLDLFKALNDRHGHHVGDEVLRAVASAIGAAVRDIDVPARYGGEEFVVLLRNPSPAVAVEVGERIRAAVGALDLRAHGIRSVSVSVGAAVQVAADEPIEDIIEAADRALYRAKRQGRNRVVAA